jgi:hypothetical protein
MAPSRQLKLQQLIAAAKSEKELDFAAGPTTFGGRKGLAEIEAAFNKASVLTHNFASAREMNAMAARVISEHAGGKATTDMYLGSLAFAALQRVTRSKRSTGQEPFLDYAGDGRDGAQKRRAGLLVAARHYIQSWKLIAADKRQKYEDLSIPI